MFNSQSLSRKGPLGSVWVAAYCHKRLKKTQVTATDIPFSVDKMLQDEFEVITYRVLGYFLLGVVRIYSKKVEYLFNDCHKVLVEVKGFVVGESSHPRAQKFASEGVSLITRPISFELDTFDLGAIEANANGAHQKSQEDITLKDCSWRQGELVPYAIWQNNWEEVGSSQVTCPTDATEVEDVFPLAVVYAGHEAILEWPQEFRVSQEMPKRLLTFEDHQDRNFDEDNLGTWEQIRDPEAALLSEKAKCLSNEEELDLSNLVTRIQRHQDAGDLTNEKLQEDEGSEREGECLEMTVPLDGETEKFIVTNIEVNFAPQLGAASDGECLVGEEGSSFSDLETGIERLREDDLMQEATAELEMLAFEDGKAQRLTDTESEVDISPKETDKLSEIVSCDSPDPDVVMIGLPTSSTVESTPVAKLPTDAEGGLKPDFMLVPTPALTERRRTKRKRQCLVDDLIVLPNELIKKFLRDASDLVRKRRHAAPDPFTSRKATWSLTFEEPSIPYSSAELRSLHFVKNIKFPEVREDAEIFCSREDVGNSVPHEDVEVPACNQDVEMWTTCQDADISDPCKDIEVLQFKVSEPAYADGSSEQAGIAPETPTQQVSSWRSFERPGFANSDEMRPKSPLKSVALENEPAVNEDQYLSFTLMDEDLHSLEGERDEAYGWTGRTRAAAKHLNKVFQRLKDKGKAASLLQISERRTRKENARLFYEILVLKSNGFIDINQQTAHADILIRKLPKFEHAVHAEDPKSST